jgi:uncharacterized protein YbaP (TraB family)
MPASETGFSFCHRYKYNGLVATPHQIIMKRLFVLSIALLPYLLHAQPPVKKKNYPSLLWEISGNGLKKPSFLFGTMHVSSKMAFHLADSFYIGLRNADMVALETNPESWQEDMSKYDLGSGYNDYGYSLTNYLSAPDDYFSINTLKFYKYDKKVEKTLYSNPSTINNLLYRSYGNESSDFEEDTYLDMYIYQCGKKWGKKVAGVEKYGESMKLMIEAYNDAAKDKDKKERSYDAEDGYSSGNLQEAYRTGNLDWLDSINRYNSFSTAFDEKFLYRRNEIQAGSIDSILKTGQSLFVGVGAAHLPGSRGVIEMLRDKGYKLRPVKMGERDSQHKNQVEKIRVPVSFTSQSAEDGVYKVDIPGKFYKFGDDASLDQRQYADMANGSYYMVTRIMTNAWMWGHTTDRVYRVIDSLLYENIPGKIINKTTIVRNGYKGIDLTNRTRRGDLQRYNIFITPFEIVVFKMSGTGDYVKDGDEAKKFFSSIQLKEFNPGSGPGQVPGAGPGQAGGSGPGHGWKKYSPPYGGFAVNLPHEPYTGNDGNWIYDAEDKATNTQYRVVRTDIHNYHFVEEDTFDLGLMDESFSASEFIDKQLNRRQTTYKGYPALDAQYKDKTGGVYLARFIIQGPHYYTLLAHGRQETTGMQHFLNSFEIKPFVYKASKERRDTALYYTVKTPVFPESGKEKLDIPNYNSPGGGDDEESEGDILLSGTFRSKIISNDTTGEKIFVSFFKSQRYTYIRDSSVLEDDNRISVFGDTTLIVKTKRKYELPDGTRVWETVVTDTGSSRTIRSKTLYKDGIGYGLITQSDTLSPPGDFVQSFFDTFTPADTLTGISPFRKKTDLFFSDFMSRDSLVHQRAVKGIHLIGFDSTDLPLLKKMIASVNWSEKKYLDTKKALVGKLEHIRTKEASDFLRDQYYAAGDTLELQYTALEVLLQQKTKYAFTVFRDIVASEPPVLNIGSVNPAYLSLNRFRFSYNSYDNGSFMDDLYDSLELAKTILPDLLPLLNLDDYKESIMQLLGQLADSNLVKAKDYEAWFSKFYLEARQELKKQAIAEKQKAINKAEQEKDDKKTDYLITDDPDKDSGNEKLSLYATLLMPFWESKAGVQPVIGQILASSDKQLKYRTLLLLLRNNKPYPDSLPDYFAGMDEYRYELYTALKEMDMEAKFPGRYNTHLDLGRSKLLKEKSYEKPDTLAYIDRLPATIKEKTGYIYFFKYKMKKDDMSWKLATVGLVPKDSAVFEFKDEDADDNSFLSSDYTVQYMYDFTTFTDTRIRDDQPLTEQLQKELKKILYSRRKSAKEFYNKNNNEGYDLTVEEEPE